MELYYYEDCEYSQTIINTIFKLKIQDKFKLKDIHLHPHYAEELKEMTGSKIVPCLVNDKVPLTEAKVIRKYILSQFQ